MIPDELIAWRKKHGLTQQQLSDMLGVTKPCISQWELGKRHIPAFLHIALKCLKVKKGGKTQGKRKMKKRKRKGVKR